MNFLMCKNLSRYTSSLQIFKLLKRNITTHYDVLQLPRNCTNKDVRAAYLKLSKQFHPDVQGPTKSRKQFIQITEAYQTLSKPYLRLRYDQDLLARDKMSYSSSSSSSSSDRVHSTQYYSPWEDKSNFEQRTGPYYGVHGLEKMSNTRIVLLLVGLTVFGAVFGFISANVGNYFSSSFNANRKQLDQRNAMAESHYAAVRAEASKYTNEEQLQRMVERMAKSSNT